MGILSQGLRIAPPEAPATGYMVLSQSLSYVCALVYTYMNAYTFDLSTCYSTRLIIHIFAKQFGKGIYFADLVSKSAQYCFTDKKNPVGLMLLSEVGLGEVYELKKAKVGSHSVVLLCAVIIFGHGAVVWFDVEVSDLFIFEFHHIPSPPKKKKNYISSF